MPLFSFILIFTLLYAILGATKVLQGKAWINITIALMVSLVAMFSGSVFELVNVITPWFVLLLVFVILLMLIFQTLGATEKDIASVLAKEKIVHWSIIGAGLLILLAGLGSIWGQQLTTMAGGEPVTTNITASSGTSSLEQNLYATFYNPKVLGLIFVFLIAVFAIAFLAGSG